MLYCSGTHQVCPLPTAGMLWEAFRWVPPASAVWGAAGGSRVGMDVDPCPGNYGQLPAVLGSCQCRGVPAPRLGGRVLAHAPGQAEGGVVAGQGTVTPWTSMLLTTHHVQDRMPGQGACSLQSALCLCRLLGEKTHVGAYFWQHPLAKIWFLSSSSSHAREPQGWFSEWHTRASQLWCKIRGCRGEFCECKTQRCHYGIETWTWTSLNLSFLLQIPLLSPLLCSQLSRFQAISPQATSCYLAAK